MRIPIYQLDAFTDRLFGGNPAAVCPLESWPADDVLQSIAAENNLAETAFFIPDGDNYALRWFTPTTEVDLCGHATLASAEIVLRVFRPDIQTVRFSTRKAGVLTVTRRGASLEMDFPARPPVPARLSPDLTHALGARPSEVLAARDLVAVFETQDQILALAPDMKSIAALDTFAVIATAPGDGGVDYVARFFAPAQGIDEDPATGSAQCSLAPYWAARLGKIRLTARQLSRRGADFTCEVAGERVRIAGQVVLYLEGTIEV